MHMAGPVMQLPVLARIARIRISFHGLRRPVFCNQHICEIFQPVITTPGLLRVNSEKNQEIVSFFAVIRNTENSAGLPVVALSFFMTWAVATEISVKPFLSSTRPSSLRSNP